MLPKLLEADHDTFDAIIIDESHYAKTQKAIRAKAVAAICAHNPTAIKLALTGTPIDNQPMDLWHQLECLWPGRFGSWFSFCKAYCNSRANEYATTGLEFFGLNQARAAELNERLTHVSCRVTKKEVAHLLPPFKVDTVRIRPTKKIDYRQLMVTLKDPMRDHKNKLDTWCRDAGETKFNHAKEFVAQALESGKTHVCVLTYNIETAEKLGALLREDGHPVTVVTGEVVVSKRHGVLNEAKAATKSVLVASMKSIKEGIDLTPYTYILVAELYWQPSLISQVLARFHRLTSKAKGFCQILVLEGTIEEKIAHVLAAKYNDSSAVMQSGMSEEQIETALTVKMSDDEFVAELRKAAASRHEDDEYT